MNPTVFDQNTVIVPFRLNLLLRFKLLAFLLKNNVPWLLAGRLCLFQTVPCWAPGIRRMPLERVTSLLSKKPGSGASLTHNVVFVDLKNRNEPGRKLELSPDIGVNYRSRVHGLLEAAKDYFSQVEEQSLLGSPHASMLASHKKTVIKTILESQSVKTEIQNLPHKQGHGLATEYANEIVGNRHLLMIRICHVVLSFLARRFFKDIHIDGIDHVKGISSRNKIIYLPTHRSHLDFLLLPLFLFKNGVEVPQIASSNHLSRFMLRSLIHWASGYFIRRKKMDALYNSILFEFLKISQEEGTPEMVFIEGTRSKTGETLQPKSGMLSQYIDAYMHQKCHPIAFVPVNITYDKVLERSHVLEPIIQHKLDKQLLNRDELNSLRTLPSQGLWTMFKTFCATLKNGGQASVYIHCGQPILLDEALQRHALSLDMDLPRADGIPHPKVRAVARDIARKACETMNSLTPLTTIGVASLLFWQNTAVSPAELVSFASLMHKLQDRAGFFHRNYLSPNLSVHDLHHIRMLMPSRLQPEAFSETIHHTQELTITLQDRVFTYLNQRNLIHGFILPTFVAKKILIDGIQEPQNLLDHFEQESQHLSAKYHIDFGNIEWRKKISAILRVLQDESLVAISGNLTTIRVVADAKGRRHLESLAKLSSVL